MPDTPTADTLNEFDIVLSVTEAALNAQFLHLFLTPLPKKNDNGETADPPPPDSSEPEPDGEYLISHRLELKITSTRKDGLFGYIECPRIDMINLSTTADKKRTVKVCFKFLDNKPATKVNADLGLPAYDAKYDSECRYWDANKPDDEGRPTLCSAKINGYTVSFEASLGRADIQQLEEKYMYPSTYKKVKVGVDSKSLLASSLFCLFEGTQIANTFTMVDASGKACASGSMVSQTMLLFTNHYAQDKPKTATTGNGLPSPDNPFVLGYGISQTISQPQPGVPVFDPMNFQFSVTGSEAKFATINFLMLTHSITDDSNVEKNLNAGYFRRNFFDVINAKYVNSTTKTPVFDGIMAVSTGLFMKEYLIKFVSPIYWVPPPAGSTVTAKDDFSNHSISKATDWSWTINDSDWLVSKVTYWKGNNKLKINYDSDATANLAVDGQRRIYVNIDGSAHVNYKYDSTVGTITSDITVPYKDRLILSSGDGAKWHVARDTANYKFPLMEDDPDNKGKKRIVFTEDSSKPGIYVKVDVTGVFAVAEFMGLMKSAGISEYLNKGIAAVANFEMNFDALQNRINAGLTNLNISLIMPASDVVTFNGLSTDKDSNVYSLVKYRTITGGGRIEEKKEEKKS